MVRAIQIGMLAAAMALGQADQAARKAQEKKPDNALADLFGPKLDQAAVERGQKIFEPACGFCHGMDARGKSGPDLVRSTLVLHDEKGETIGPVIRGGRPDRGMPPFGSMTQEQIADISVFLHSKAAGVSNRFTYEIKGLMTGDAKQGEAFFNGEGKCSTCHSPTGDLAHVAGQYEAAELQRRFLYPSPNMLDVYMGKAVKMGAPATVTVTLPSGEKVTGNLVHADEFNVSLRDNGGWYKSFERDQTAKVELQDPRAVHEAMLATYTDRQMHNMLAYLETLK